MKKYKITEFQHAVFICPKCDGDRFVGEPNTCDLCEGEARSLCIEYCVYGALKEGKRE